MKIAIVLAAALLAARPALAQTQPMVPLTTYVQQDFPKNLVARYRAKTPAAEMIAHDVAIRCSALYFVFSAMLEDETALELQQQRQSFAQASLKFQESAVKMRSVGTTSRVEPVGWEERQMIIADSFLYKERIGSAKALNNNMFSDPLIAGDFNICEILLSHLIAEP